METSFVEWVARVLVTIAAGCFLAIFVLAGLEWIRRRREK
jgi:hypothetical protein